MTLVYAASEFAIDEKISKVTKINNLFLFIPTPYHKSISYYFIKLNLKP